MLEASLAAFNRQPHIACISEHWLTSGDEKYCNMQDYHVVTSRSRSLLRRGIAYGGVLIYLRKNIDFKVLDRVHSLALDSVCEMTGVILVDYNIFVICVYRAPDLNNFLQFMIIVEKVLATFGLGQKLCICGDFNLNFFDNLNRETMAFLNLMGSYGFTQTITQPTRQNNCIDNVFINFNHQNFSTSVTDLGYSDHRAQLVSFPTHLNNKAAPVKLIKTRPITDESKSKFCNIVRQLDWSFVHDTIFTTDKKFEIFQTNLSDSAKLAFIEKTKLIKCGTSRPISFTPELKRLRKNLKKVTELCKSSPSAALAERKSKLRKHYRISLKNAKKKSNDNRLARSPNPNKTAWEIIKQNEVKGNTAENSNITPDEFNANFSDAPLAIVNNLPPSDTDPRDLLENFNVSHINDEFSFQEVTTQTVTNAMVSLTKKKGRDLYGLNLDVILCVQSEIAPVLAALINMCFNDSVFPSCLKSALIHPVLKRGDKNTASNYRPISILPILGKIMEKIMTDQITQYITFFNILSPSQFGFRKKLSTTDAVNFFNTFISNSFNNNTFIYANLCDLSRAFETLNHNILLQKLAHYNFQNTSIQFIKSYLQDRVHIVKLGERLSVPRRVNLGIATGSILGPLIFLLYINDLPSNLPVYGKSSIFADDTTLFVEEKDEGEAIRRGELALAQAQVWFDSNRLHLNRNKTQAIMISLKKITIPNNPSSVKLLGFHVDPQLNWHAHISHVSGILNNRVFLIRRLQKEVSPPVLKNAYYGLIHSILSYGVLLWGHTSACQRLFIIQKCVIRLLSYAKSRDHAKPLFRKLNILTLPSLFILRSLLNVKHNLSSHQTSESFHTYNTRNKRNLVPARHRVNAARNGSNYHGIQFFNKLPTSIRELPDKAFKTHLEDYLKEKAFYSFHEFLSCPDLDAA